MSGIAGIYRFDGGSVAADTVAAMTEAIAATVSAATDPPSNR